MQLIIEWPSSFECRLYRPCVFVAFSLFTQFFLLVALIVEKAILSMLFFIVHITRSEQTFNISWLTDGHSVLDPVSLISEANRSLGILLVTISIVNWWVVFIILFYFILAMIFKYYLKYRSILCDFFSYFPSNLVGLCRVINYIFFPFLKCEYINGHQKGLGERRGSFGCNLDSYIFCKENNFNWQGTGFSCKLK